MAELVHLAGPQVEFDGVQRQRCVWCGALIDEKPLARMATIIEEGESGEQAAERLRRIRWEGWVAIDGKSRWRVNQPDDNKAPERSCMRLLPDEGT